MLVKKKWAVFLGGSIGMILGLGFATLPKNVEAQHQKVSVDEFIKEIPLPTIQWEPQMLGDRLSVGGLPRQMAVGSLKGSVDSWVDDFRDALATTSWVIDERRVERENGQEIWFIATSKHDTLLRSVALFDASTTKHLRTQVLLSVRDTQLNLEKSISKDFPTSCVVVSSTASQDGIAHQNMVLLHCAMSVQESSAAMLRQLGRSQRWLINDEYHKAAAYAGAHEGWVFWIDDASSRGHEQSAVMVHRWRN